MMRITQAAGVISALGRSVLAATGELGGLALFAAHSAASVKRARRLTGRVVHATYELGVRCVPVILIVALFTGLVLGLQCYVILARFGSEAALGTLVSLTLVRELGPVRSFGLNGSVLPLLGPTTFRDLIGSAGDTALTPTFWTFKGYDEWETQFAVRGVDFIRQTPVLLAGYYAARAGALDPYIAVREAYAARRAEEIQR